MKIFIIFILAIITHSFVAQSSTMPTSEKKNVANNSAYFRYKYLIFEQNRLNICIGEDSNKSPDRTILLNSLLNECPFSLSVDSIEVPSAVKDSISVFKFEFNSFNKEFSDGLCFKEPSDTIVLGVDNNAYSFFLHGFGKNEFEVLFRMYFKRILDVSTINEICYFYIRSVLGYSKNQIITAQNFSEMKEKYNLFESQLRNYSIEVGPPHQPKSFTRLDDEMIFRCSFYTIERQSIFGIAINKRTFIFSHRGLESENCELVDVVNGSPQTK